MANRPEAGCTPKRLQVVGSTGLVRDRSHENHPQRRCASEQLASLYAFDPCLGQLDAVTGVGWSTADDVGGSFIEGNRPPWIARPERRRTRTRCEPSGPQERLGMNINMEDRWLAHLALGLGSLDLRYEAKPGLVHRGFCKADQWSDVGPGLRTPFSARRSAFMALAWTAAGVTMQLVQCLAS